MEKKKIDFCIGIFDNLTEKGLEKIRKDISNCEIYGIGVYTDDVVIKDFYTYPVNSLEKRMKVAKNIEGVKFVFPLNTSEPEKIKEIIRNEVTNFLEQNKN